MKKNLLLVSLSLLLWSCMKDHSEVPYGGKEVEIKFSTSALDTRAPIIDVATYEKKIHTIDILVFQGDGTTQNTDNAQFLYSRYAWKKNGSEDRYNAILKIGQKLDIYFAVNANAIISGANITEGMKWKDVRNLLQMENPDQIDVVDGLPMWGFLLNQSVADAPINSFNTIQLLRSVASVSAQVLSTNFELANGHIAYAADRGFLAFSPSNVDVNTKEPEVPADMLTTKQWRKAPSDDNSLEGLFYIYENDADAVNGKHYTKIILEGRWDGSANPGNTFYPLAFRRPDTDEKLQVKRNRKYVVIIKNVNGDGYPSLEDAKEAEDLNMDYKVIDWDRWTDNDIIVYGTQYISLSNDINENLSKQAVLYRPAGSEDFIMFDTNIPLNSFALKMVDSTGLDCGTYPDPNNKSVIENNRFKVEVLDGRFKFTSKVVFDKTSDNPTKLIVTAGGVVKFEIKISQVDGSSEDWINGGIIDSDF